jgi:radical SAM protein with 4Fe4S-binding SPASM domain
VSFNVAEWHAPDTHRTYERFAPVNEEFRLYRREGSEWRWKNGKRELCTAPWRSITLLCDGTLVPCCRDPRAVHRFGTVADGVLAVWNSREYQRFRERMASGCVNLPICSVCPGE